MKYFKIIIILSLIVGLSSCRSDFETVASTGNLIFSKDTIYLDTIFTGLKSSTYTLKVYNKSKKDINIPTIQLSKNTASKYSLTIEGIKGSTFSNVSLFAKDSLYVFIETNPSFSDANPTDFLYTDVIEFDSGVNLQKVELVTLVQDAIFLHTPTLSDGSLQTVTVQGKEVSGFYLDDSELVFNNTKPYVIYGTAVVPSGKNVVFDAGARVHFHNASGLVVESGASISIDGTTSTTDSLEGEVVFEGDRLEPTYENIAGQWNGLILDTGINSSSISHLTLKNAINGITVEENTSTLTLSNSQIYNCANYGLLAKNAYLTAENMVINNCGLASLACTNGGSYSFNHCTFNNNWSNSIQTSVLVSNVSITTPTTSNPLIKAAFLNSIIYGTFSNELSLKQSTDAVFNYNFFNCLIKYLGNTSTGLYQFNTDTTHYSNIILNEDPKFLNPSLNKFNIDNSSPAFEQGSPSYIVPNDILGRTRTSPPDLGAYQNEVFPEVSN
jgi:hypothetical protein